MLKVNSSRAFVGMPALRRAILGSTLLSTMAFDAVPAFAQTETDQIQEIVVTARKRDETLLSVPVAVSAVGGAELARKNIVTLQGIADQIPVLLVTRAVSGTGGIIAIRGIGSSSQDGGVEASVSVNVDGVQVSRGLVTQTAFFDLQQVEVLKGPQALFFGKNSPAGVISLTSKGPGSRLEGFAKVGYEFIANERIAEAGIGGPISDTLGARLALRYSKMDGFMKNNAQPIANNPIFPGYSLPGNAGIERGPASKFLVGRLTIDYHPTDNFSAVMKVLGNKYTDNGITTIYQSAACGQGPNGKPVSFGVVASQSECKVDNRFTQSNIPDLLSANFPVNSHGNKLFTDSKSVLSSLQLNYDTGPVNLTSVSGLYYLDNENFGNFSYDEFALFPGQNFEKSRIFTQELRALTDLGGRINFAAGVFFDDNRRHVGGAGGGIARTPDPATGFRTGLLNDSVVTGSTYSAFGQVIWKITDTVELAGGARYTNEKKRGTLQNLFKSQNLVNGVLQFARIRDVGNVLSINFSDSDVSPEVTLAWHPTRDSTLYGAYRTGYKSGGISQATTLLQSATSGQLTFGSESAKGGEVGYKAEVFDRRLTLDANVYKYKFAGLQRSSLDASTASFTIRNAAAATSKGFEFATRYRVSSDLNVSGSLNHNISKYGAFPGAACYNGQKTGCAPLPQAPALRGQDLTGFALSRAPRWTWTLGVDYSRPVFSDWNIGLTADVKHSSSYRTQDDGDPAGIQGAYNKLNAGVRLYQPDGAWDLGVVGRNLTNEYVLLVTSGRPGGAPGDLGGAIDRPREILLQAAYRF